MKADPDDWERRWGACQQETEAELTLAGGARRVDGILETRVWVRWLNGGWPKITIKQAYAAAHMLGRSRQLREAFGCAAAVGHVVAFIETLLVEESR